MPSSAFLFDCLRDCERHFFLPRACNDLHSNRPAFRRLTSGNYHSRHTQQVEPLAITPRIEIFHRLAIDSPFALSMTEGGDGGDRAEQDGVLSHLLKYLEP